jgi:hypothetical protein
MTFTYFVGMEGAFEADYNDLLRAFARRFVKEYC